jgi:hypothetical protein
LAWVRWANPFGYYSPDKAAEHVQWGNAAVLVAAGVVLFGIARQTLMRRDLA